MASRNKSSGLSIGIDTGPTADEGVSNQRISDLPIAVIDFETTGLTPGYDRAVELSIVRIEPDGSSKLALNSLINPKRPVSCTEIHGITDADVANAPTFSQLSGDVLAACQGCIIAAYNVYFDIEFMRTELGLADVFHDPPYLCLMYLQPMLGLGRRCKLSEACERFGIEYTPTHIAADDALAASRLFGVYRQELNRQGVQTFAELGELKDYKFTKSFALPPFRAPEHYGLKTASVAKPRRAQLAGLDSTQQAMNAYWEVLKCAVMDLSISDDEMDLIAGERQRGGLKEEQVRVLHARAFASAISQFTKDQWVDDREVRALRRLHDCLGRLGWAPGS
jgi:DNA polymerase III epsilon subunit-like protein